MRCPWPVLRAAKAMRTAVEIVLIADDPIARTDIPVLAETHGWMCVIEEQPGHVRYRLTKR
jgi:tRNA 2-thiouridine synthesizing protein A